MDTRNFFILTAGLIAGLCIGTALGTFWFAPATAGHEPASVCPVAEPASGATVSGSSTPDSGLISFLFVQQGQGGSLVKGTNGTMTLTLTGVRPETVYFSDTPNRISGEISTGLFTSSSLWNATSSPNAALMLAGAPAANDTVILTLSDPQYNRTSATLQYSAVAVPDYQGEGLLAFRTFADPGVPEHFDQAMLFIDNAQIPVSSINTTGDGDHPGIIILS